MKRTEPVFTSMEAVRRGGWPKLKTYIRRKNDTIFVFGFIPNSIVGNINCVGYNNLCAHGPFYDTGGN